MFSELSWHSRELLKLTWHFQISISIASESCNFMLVFVASQFLQICINIAVLYYSGIVIIFLFCYCSIWALHKINHPFILEENNKIKRWIVNNNLSKKNSLRIIFLFLFLLSYWGREEILNGRNTNKILKLIMTKDQWKYPHFSSSTNICQILIISAWVGKQGN